MEDLLVACNVHCYIITERNTSYNYSFMLLNEERTNIGFACCPIHSCTCMLSLIRHCLMYQFPKTERKLPSRKDNTTESTLVSIVQFSHFSYHIIRHFYEHKLYRNKTNQNKHLTFQGQKPHHLFCV